MHDPRAVIAVVTAAVSVPVIAAVRTARRVFRASKTWKSLGKRLNGKLYRFLPDSPAARKEYIIFERFTKRRRVYKLGNVKYVS